MLRSRGWTDNLIKTFLPEPDATATNPQDKSGPEMALYRADRVKRIERSRWFRTAHGGSARRKEGARRAVATKTHTLLREADEMRVTVRVLCREEVTRQAVASYVASRRDDVPDDVDRVIVNYIRHELTDYEDTLQGIRGRVGTDDAFLEISEKVFEAIEEAYPWLAEECHRQVERRWARS